MEPTIKRDEIIIADFSAYRSSLPKRWDIVVFEPLQEKSLWASRVVGLPGETVTSVDGTLIINGSPVETPKELSLYYVLPPSMASSDISFPYKIPNNSYFLLGDNSPNAADSRYWGALPFSNIKGRIVK